MDHRVSFHLVLMLLIVLRCLDALIDKKPHQMTGKMDKTLPRMIEASGKL